MSRRPLAISTPVALGRWKRKTAVMSPRWIRNCNAHCWRRSRKNGLSMALSVREMEHSDQVSICRSSAQGYWVVDPLDGTTNFSSGFLCFGISVALVITGKSRLAVVYDPVHKECFSAEAGGGAYLNERRMICNQTQRLAECIANVDYKRLVGELAVRLVHSPPYRSQRNLGSSVLEWCWLAAGRIQLYLHGGQKLWDFAAGYLILREAGGAATSLSGKPLDLRQPEETICGCRSESRLIESMDQTGSISTDLNRIHRCSFALE